MELLSKTRVINRLLQRADGTRSGYAELVQSLRDMIAANVFLIDAGGTVLAHSMAETYEFVGVPKSVTGQAQVPKEYADKLVREDRTLINMHEVTPFCMTQNGDNRSSKFVTFIPIQGSTDRLGTLLLTRHSGRFTEEDIVLAEYGATVIGLEMTRATLDKKQQEGRDRSIVQMAVGSLSYSELEAVEHIFGELNGREGLLVASRIADRAGITRSVIVNALRKLESAGVVEARSLGMKGTHIKILNEKLLPILEDIKSR
jgi:transcriptional pleiotropic repressor